MKKGNFKKDFFTIPNSITIVRVIAIPFLIWLMYLSPDKGPSTLHFWASWLFVIIAFTDLFDGYLARKWDQVTITGQFLDPLADKLLVTSMLIALVDLNRITGTIAILMIGRDLAISGLRSIAASEGITISASPLGKIKTTFQMFALMFLLIQGTYDWDFLFVKVPFDFNKQGNMFLYIALVISYVGAIEYVYNFIKVAFKDEKETPQS